MGFVMFDIEHLTCTCALISIHSLMIVTFHTRVRTYLSSIVAFECAFRYLPLLLTKSSLILIQALYKHPFVIRVSIKLPNAIFALTRKLLAKIDLLCQGPTSAFAQVGNVNYQFVIVKRSVHIFVLSLSTKALMTRLRFVQGIAISFRMIVRV